MLTRLLYVCIWVEESDATRFGSLRKSRKRAVMTFANLHSATSPSTLYAADSLAKTDDANFPLTKALKDEPTNEVTNRKERKVFFEKSRPNFPIFPRRIFVLALSFSSPSPSSRSRNGSLGRYAIIKIYWGDSRTWWKCKGTRLVVALYSFLYDCPLA